MTANTVLREITTRSAGAAGAIVLLAILNGLTLATSSLAVFADAIVRDLHWSRAAIGGGATFAQLGLACAATGIGWLADRFGARAVLLPSVVVTGTAFVCLSLVAAIPALFFACLFIIGACSVSTFLCGGKIISSWFLRHRAFTLGLVGVGVGLSGIITPSMVEFLLDHVGWRSAFVVLGGAVLVAAVPVVILFAHENSAASSAVDASADSDLDGAPRITGWQATRTRIFWIIVLSQAASVFAYMGIVPQGMSIFMDRGLPRETAIVALSFIPAGTASANLIIGWLLDRFGKPSLVIPFAAISIVGLLLVGFGSNPLLLLAGAALFGLGVGGETSVSSYFITRFFGVRNYGGIYGVIMPILMTSAAPASVIAGAFFDSTGSYDFAIASVLAVQIVGVIAFALLPAYTYPTEEARNRRARTGMQGARDEVVADPAQGPVTEPI